MKKICLVCDIPNWAFDIIAHKLERTLEGVFDVDVDYFDMRSEQENFFEFIEKHKEYDILHFFWRKNLILFEDKTFIEKAERNYANVNEYIETIKNKISTGAYDFLFLEPDEIDMYANIFNKYANSYYVTSQKLYEKYMNIDSYNKPYGVVHDLFSSEILHPINIERLDNYNRSFVVGWVGNSNFNFKGLDLKGFHTILKPVIEELKNEGYDITEHYADRNEKWRSADEMPEYYSKIDVCICVSITEGTPLPILEAMTCGVPVISTNVGVVSEVFGKLQREYIIGDREHDDDDVIKQKLKDKLINLYNNRSKLKTLSEENINSIIQYDNGKIRQEYIDYFNSIH